MTASHSREYLQVSDGYQYWQGIRGDAFFMIYGTKPAYSEKMPSTLR